MTMTNELAVITNTDQVAIPQVIWNEEQVAAQLQELLSTYTGRQYTEDEIKNAKKDRAAVNAIAKQLDAAAKRVKELYNEPVVQFTEAIKRYKAMTSEVSGAIDAQVKAVEEAQRADRRKALEALYKVNCPAELEVLVPFDRILSPKWLLKSTAESTAKQELLTAIERVQQERMILRDQAGDLFQQVDRVYLKNLNIREALEEHRHILEAQRAHREAEAAAAAERAAKAATPVIPASDDQVHAENEGRAEARRQAAIASFAIENSMGAAPEQAKWYNFGAMLTRRDIDKLKKFCADNGIVLKKARMDK